MASAPAVEAPPGVKIDVIALAKFELATGRLVTADSAFVAIADLRDVDLDLQLTWRGIFAGHGMIFRHQDTRRVVDLSISLIADILKRFTVDASMRFIHRDVLIVTRIGRLKACRLDVYRYDPGTVIWNVDEIQSWTVPCDLFDMIALSDEGEDDVDWGGVSSAVVAPYKKETPWAQKVHRFEWRTTTKKKPRKEER